MRTNILSVSQKEAARELWNNEYPAALRQDNAAEQQSFFDSLSDLQHILILDNKVLAWAFSFLRDGERWFAVIVSAGSKKQGYGTVLLDELKQKHKKLSGWVIDHDNDRKQDGTAYQSPIGFYRKNNFKVIPAVRLSTGGISAVKIEWQKNEPI